MEQENHAFFHLNTRIIYIMNVLLLKIEIHGRKLLNKQNIIEKIIIIIKILCRCSTKFEYDSNDFESWGYCENIKCFKTSTDKKGFADSRKSCKQDGADLASIHNEYEQSYVTALLREKYNDYWLGLWAPDGKTFYYEDDSEFDYANWMSNKPTYSSNVMILFLF